MKLTCPYCKKELDIMTIEMDKDLRFVFEALPSFGTRYSHLVMGYCQLFGVTPFSVKAKKLRLIIEEMKRLFDAQAFGYQKQSYRISHAGIGEALDLVIKKNFPDHLENHNYLKKVMITISEREQKDGTRTAEAEMKAREDKQRACGDRVRRDTGDGVEETITETQRRRNLERLGDIIKSIGG